MAREEYVEREAEGQQKIPESLFDLMSDLQHYTVLARDRRADIDPNFFTYRRTRAFLRIGFTTGFAEVLLLPFLFPLAVGTIHGVVPIFGHAPMNAFERYYGEFLPAWISALVTLFLCRQVFIGEGPLWNVGFRRFLEGRSAVLLAGGLLTYFALRLTWVTLPPESLFRFVDASNALPQMLREWLFQTLDLWTVLYPHLIQAGYASLIQCLVALVLPWIWLVGHELWVRRTRKRAEAILS
jgi:hypothetical protein